MSEPITIYYDPLSQPCRAVLAVCLIYNIPHKIHNILFLKRQQLSPEYAKINPLKKVPAIDDNGFILAESHSILRYLCDTRGTDDALYPKDPKKRAEVDRYLDWHHSNTRINCTRYYLASTKDLFPPNVIPWTKEGQIEGLEKALKTIEDVFLKDKNYLASEDKMTIADLSAACEMMQLKRLKEGVDFSKFPKLEKWLNRCMENPALKATHQKIMENSKL